MDGRILGHNESSTSAGTRSPGAPTSAWRSAGRDAAGIAADNMFVGDDLTDLELASGLTYRFSEETRHNTVVDRTDREQRMVRGQESNVFRGAGFRELGPEAAGRLVAQMDEVKDRERDEGEQMRSRGWHRWREEDGGERG